MVRSLAHRSSCQPVGDGLQAGGGGSEPDMPALGQTIELVWPPTGKWHRAIVLKRIDTKQKNLFEVSYPEEDSAVERVDFSPNVTPRAAGSSGGRSRSGGSGGRKKQKQLREWRIASR